MNADNFSEFLSSHSRLFHLSYVELETLVLEFPYAQNLHLLLFAKSWLEQHPQAEANLRSAALYSTDRTKLYAFVKELSGQLAVPSYQFNMNEDYLELAELPRLPELQELPLMETGSTFLFEEIPSKSLEAQPILQPRRKASPPPAPSPEEIREQLSRLFLLDEEVIVREEKPATPLKQPKKAMPPKNNAFIENLRKQLSRRLEEEHLQATSARAFSDSSVQQVQPAPKSAFNSWNSQLSVSYLQERLDALRNALQIQDQPHGHDPAETIAWESIRENSDIASETLAEILLRQGQTEKALQVYQRLILLFPEKTAFFAAKIEHIKNKQL